MKTIIKLVAGTAMLAGSLGAAQAAITPPSSGSSQLLFFVTDPNDNQTYTEVLTQTVGSGSTVFTKQQAIDNAGQADPDNAIPAKITDSTSFTYAASGNTDLAAFVSAHSADASALQYGVMGGAYSAGNPTGRKAIGAVLMVTSSPDQSPLINGEAKTIGTEVANSGLDADISTLNQGTFDTHNGTSAGVIGTPASVAQAIDWYGAGTNVTANIGTGMELWGMGSNGTSGGSSIAYDLGKLTFDGSTLSFVANTAGTTPPPMPLPAAAWLLGSGLLGLMGIGRRRNAVAA